MGDFIVDGWDNFCRVFEIPTRYPNGYCFGGGKPVNFQMLDWFNPIPDIPQPGIPKDEWLEKVGDISEKRISLEDLRLSVVPFVRSKDYVKRGSDYLILFDFGAVIRFRG